MYVFTWLACLTKSIFYNQLYLSNDFDRFFYYAMQDYVRHVTSRKKFEFCTYFWNGLYVLINSSIS